MSLLQQILWESSSDSDTEDENEDSFEDVNVSLLRRNKVYLPRIDRLRKWDENTFLERFRLSKNLANALASHLAHLLVLGTMKNKAITPIQQVLIALEYYACGSFQRCIADTAGVNKSSVSRIIYRVSKAIARMRPEWVLMPQNSEQMKRTATEFYAISAFPKVIGAIDCTHIPIKSPGGPDAENYRNRKLIFSINVQAICDAKLYITNIVARWPGSSHDSHIFNCSVIKSRFVAGEFQEYWLLGDKGYAVKPYMMTPLRNPITQAEKLYNESQIRTRNVVERMFGCWKRRFPVLSMKIRTDLKRAQPIIVATAVLHNICKKMNQEMPPMINNNHSDSPDEDSEFTGSLSRYDDHNRTTLINNYFGAMQSN